jgi:hypothetical protein
LSAVACACRASLTSPPDTVGDALDVTGVLLARSCDRDNVALERFEASSDRLRVVERRRAIVESAYTQVLTLVVALGSAVIYFLCVRRRVVPRASRARARSQRRPAASSSSLSLAAATASSRAARTSTLAAL